MNPHQLVSSALAAALSLGLGAAVTTAHAADAKEKCYGITKAGANDCANLSGSHSCAGQSTTSTDPAEWKYVAKGTCKSLKGMTAEEAKAAMKK